MTKFEDLLKEISESEKWVHDNWPSTKSNDYWEWAIETNFKPKLKTITTSNTTPIKSKSRLGSNHTDVEAYDYINYMKKFTKESKVIDIDDYDMLQEYKELLEDIKNDEMIAVAWEKFVIFAKMRKDPKEQPKYGPKSTK